MGKERKDDKCQEKTVNSSNDRKNNKKTTANESENPPQILRKFAKEKCSRSGKAFRPARRSFLQIHQWQLGQIILGHVSDS